MITPSFNATSSEKVLPKLALDFTTASLDSRITFTRTTDSTHPASYINSSGLIAYASNNQPRFDYTLNTGGVCKGLLIEESRSNLLLNSSGFNTASWAADTGIVVTGDTTASPDGTQNADTITFPSSNKSIAQFPTVTGLTISASIYIKGTAGETILFGCGGNQTLVTLSSSWTRFTIPNIVYASGAPIQISTYGGATARTIYVWGAQLEAGAFPTSYIPTTTAALTRNADIATMAGSNFSSWYNASEGTFVVNANVGSGTLPYLFGVTDGTSNNRMIVYRLGSPATTSTAFEARVDVSNVNQAAISVAANTTTLSFAYKANNFATSSNGNTVSIDTSGSIPSVSSLDIGHANGNIFFTNGYIKKIYYYPLRLLNSELQAFSK